MPLRWLCFLIALHDIGKADPLFQSKAPEAVDTTVASSGLLEGVDEDRVRGFRHEARSAEWLSEYLRTCGWGQEATNVVASATRGHHANFASQAPPDEHRENWHPLRNTLADLVREVLRPEPTFQPQAFDDASVVGLLLSGCTVLSDWIASGTDPYAYHTLEKSNDPEEYFAVACVRAQEVVAQLELGSNASVLLSSPLELSQVWTEIKNLRPAQETLEQVVAQGVAPGLAIIEAPTGEGKTEGAVYLTEEWHRQRGSSGAYIALPTMATSNQMYARYAAYLQKRSPNQSAPRLVHGMAWLVGDKLPSTLDIDSGEDSEEAARARSWFASSKRALLALNGVGTVDQALMAALNVKHGFLRLLGLSRKVLIVDEVHAYDAYMSTILQRLLQWCRVLRIPVILLSATLSKAQKTDLIAAYTGTYHPLSEALEPYPLLSFAPLEKQPFSAQVTRKYEEKRVAVIPEPALLDDIARAASLAAEIVLEGGCVCLLVNTVRRAQQAFQILEDWDGKGLLAEDTKLFLFHARFPTSRRDRIEKEIFKHFGPNLEDKERANPKRPRRAILVATQVVEQSLDVCFDVMLTDLAPADLLLQRVGRLHRHAVNPRYGHAKPTLHVLLPDEETPFDFGRIELKRGKDGTWRGVYDRAVLLKTLAVLPNTFRLPHDFRSLVESVYGERSLDIDSALKEEIGGAEKTYQQRMDDFTAQAQKYLIPPPDPEVFSYAQATQAFDEAQDGERRSYFRAQTRLGDSTRAALVLTEQNLINAFKNAQSKHERIASVGERYQPHKDFLKALFWQKANLPAYWVQATAQEGFEDFLQDGPAWLQRHVVVTAPKGEWRGILNGKSVQLRVHDTLGLLLETDAEVKEEGVESV